MELVSSSEGSELIDSEYDADSKGGGKSWVS